MVYKGRSPAKFDVCQLPSMVQDFSTNFSHSVLHFSKQMLEYNIN